MFSNKKRDYKKRIIFIDLHSRRDEHLTGNSSLIHKFTKVKGDFEYIYVCKKNAYLFFKDWFEKIGLKNIKICTSSPIFNKKDRLIILYPKYLSGLNYLYLKSKVYSIVSVIHGHFNSYSNNIQKKGFFEKIFNKFKNQLKDFYFLLFDNIICYSSHIFIDSKSLISPLIHKKIILINEFLNLPQIKYLNKIENKNKDNLTIGFLNFPENIEIYSLYKLIKKNNNVTCKEGWKHNLKNIKNYLKFLNKCDVVVFGKNNFYDLQVSGVINDCISLKKIIFASIRNKHYKNLINQGLIKKEWTISNQLERNLLLPKKHQLKKFKQDCSSFLENLKLENNKNITNLLDAKKVILSYQGREDGGGLLDLYRFAYNEKLIKKNKLSILTRNKKKLGNNFVTENLISTENQSEFISNYSYFFCNELNQIIFIMPNIRDLILMAFLKIFKKNIITTSIIHNPPNFSAKNNFFLNEICKIIEMSMIFFTDDLIFLSRDVSKKWKRIKNFRIVPLPVVNSKEDSLRDDESNLLRVSKTKSKKLLILGRYLPYKDLEILIDSINSKGNISEHTLTIAGKNYPKNQISILKRVCKEKNWVLNFIDSFVSISDVETLLKETDYVLFIYSFASQSGFMHLSKEFNKSIICTDVGSLKENLQNGGKGFCIKRDSLELTRILNIIYSEKLHVPSFNKFQRNAVL